MLERFGGDVDWSGYEEARDHSWHRQLHIFLYPFYYIEYGIAQLGALQVWQRSLTDRAGAVADYKKALALGGSRPLPELFAAAGIRFDFSEQIIGPLMETIRKRAREAQIPDRVFSPFRRRLAVSRFAPRTESTITTITAASRNGRDREPPRPLRPVDSLTRPGRCPCRSSALLDIPRRHEARDLRDRR